MSWQGAVQYFYSVESDREHITHKRKRAFNFFLACFFKSRSRSCVLWLCAVFEPEQFSHLPIHRFIDRNHVCVRTRAWVCMRFKQNKGLCLFQGLVFSIRLDCF